MSSANLNNLKITIITVCYNSEKTIQGTLKFVKNQNFEEIEHLIVDGGSTDKTLTIVKDDHQVKKIISEPDKGLYYAMNKGLKIASGDIIGFLNSDDFYLNDKVISRVANIFNNTSDLDACYADLVYVDKINTNKIIRYWKSSKFVPGLFSKGWSPPHPTFFVRRSLFKSFGDFDLRFNIASDVDLMIRFLEINKIKCFYIPELWVKMRLGGTTNKNLKNILLQNLEILNSLNKNKLPRNFIIFFLYKFISKLKQFYNKPNV